MESPPNGYCCGRYASYWNAFLLLKLSPRLEIGDYVHFKNFVLELRYLKNFADTNQVNIWINIFVLSVILRPDIE